MGNLLPQGHPMAGLMQSINPGMQSVMQNRLGGPGGMQNIAAGLRGAAGGQIPMQFQTPAGANAGTQIGNMGDQLGGMAGGNMYGRMDQGGAGRNDVGGMQNIANQFGGMGGGFPQFSHGGGGFNPMGGMGNQFGNMAGQLGGMGGGSMAHGNALQQNPDGSFSSVGLGAGNPVSGMNQFGRPPGYTGMGGSGIPNRGGQVGFGSSSQYPGYQPHSVPNQGMGGMMQNMAGQFGGMGGPIRKGGMDTGGMGGMGSYLSGFGSQRPGTMGGGMQFNPGMGGGGYQKPSQTMYGGQPMPYTAQQLNNPPQSGTPEWNQMNNWMKQSGYGAAVGQAM